MSDAHTPAATGAGSAEPHPVDAVLAALRAVPDSILRAVEPATTYAPALAPTDSDPAAGGAR